MNTSSSSSSSSSSTGGDGGGSSMPMVEEECSAVHFLVPMFTEAISGTNSTTSVYHSASDTAHLILGVLLLVVVAAWAAFVMDCMRIKAATKFSGVAQTTMGLYLFSWLLYWVRPEATLAERWAYATTDLLQLQHMSIAALLTAGGVIELMQSFALLAPMSIVAVTPVPAGAPKLRDAGSFWHLCWSTDMILTGLVFMLHPQHTYAATVKHLLLGTSLVLGAPLLTRAKSLAWKFELDLIRRVGVDAIEELPPSKKGNHIDWSMIAAGGSFAIAACILIAFREHETEQHIGTTRACQPSFVICVLSYLSAGISGGAALLMAAQQAVIVRRQSPARACCSSLLRRWRRGLGWTALAHQDTDDEDGDWKDPGEVAMDDLPRRSIPIDMDDDDEAAVDQLNHHDLRASYDTPASSFGSSATHVISPPASAPEHTLGDLDEYEDELVLEGDERDDQRDRRRQEEYTGEDEHET